MLLGASTGLEVRAKILISRVRVLVSLILAHTKALLYLAPRTLYKFQFYIDYSSFFNFNLNNKLYSLL